jgi:hypothetical protein
LHAPQNCKAIIDKSALNINHIKVMFCHRRRGKALMRVMYRHRGGIGKEDVEEEETRLIDASLNVCQHN